MKSEEVLSCDPDISAFIPECTSGSNLSDLSFEYEISSIEHQESSIRFLISPLAGKDCRNGFEHDLDVEKDRLVFDVIEV